jgi:long-chain acyl-CoA synthetase
MVAEKLYSVPEGEKLRLFGIFAKNRAEWTLTDIAANLYGFTTIPIYDTLGDENITYVFKHTHMTTVFVSEGALKSLVKCKDLVNVNTIICYDPFTEEQLTHFQGRGNTPLTQEPNSFSSRIFTRSARLNC